MIKKKKVNPILNELVAELKRDNSLHQVILYGSGIDLNNQNPHDFDLLVIQETDLPRIRRRGALLKNIQYHVPLDVLVLTPREMRQLKEARSRFISEILKQGVVLYEK